MASIPISQQQGGMQARQIKRTVPLLVLLLAVAGCASGPRYSEIKDSIPELSSEQGRIYFYRSSVMGAAIRPNILLNGEVVGEMVPRGIFYVDRSPGNYLVSVRTEAENTLKFTLEASQTRYVRSYISIGIVVGRPYVELVNSKDALIEIQGLAYTGVSTLAATASESTASAGDAATPSAPGDEVVKIEDLEGLLEDRELRRQ
jgi:hypothetical protein